MKFSLLMSIASACLASTVKADRDDPLESHTIKAKGIEARFIGHGARLTHLFVNDKNGKNQDVVLGYDTGKEYVKNEPDYFGGVVGRYANRIKNGTFEIDGDKFHIPENDNDGADTLHGGKQGYAQQNWTLTAQNDTSITFTLFDDNIEGFPGKVITHATYSVEGADDDKNCNSTSKSSKNPKYTVQLTSIPLDHATPIMLAQHNFWNLGAFSKGNGSALGDTLHIPYGKRYIKTDNILIPTGELAVTKDTVLDFTEPKKFGQDIFQAKDVCGLGCVGYDTAFIIDRPRNSGVEETELVQLSMSSPNTGIKMDVRTNQQGFQIFDCHDQDGSMKVKKSQQHGKNSTVPKYGCIVVETQDWIDGINHPEWNREEYQIFSPGSQPAVNWASYEFSLL